MTLNKTHYIDKMKFYKSVLLTYLLTLLPLALCYPAATHLILTHVGPCEDGYNYLVDMSEMKVNTKIYDSSISGAFNVSRDIENGWKIKATLKKCQDIRNIDTCDYFTSFYLVSNGCGGGEGAGASGEDDEVEEEAYGLIFHYAKPEMECPVRAGNYYLEDYPFFTQVNFATVSASKISTSVFGYMCVIDGISKTGDKLFCLEAYLQLLYTREHNWLEKENKTTNKRKTP